MPISDVHKEKFSPTPGRLLVTGLSVIGGIFAPLATWYVTAVQKPHAWTWLGDIVPIWAANTLIWSLTVAVETRVYDSLERNWTSARNNGYSAARILFHACSVFFGAIWVILFLVAYEGEQAVPRKPDLAMGLRFIAAAVAITGGSSFALRVFWSFPRLKCSKTGRIALSVGRINVGWLVGRGLVLLFLVVTLQPCR